MQPLPPALLGNEPQIYRIRDRRPERWWLHILLFVVTAFTSTWVGAGFAVNYRPGLLPHTGLDWNNLPASLVLGALSFSVPLLMILFAHEMGHFLFCKYYGIDASPPYFIPFPSLAGTMGAFIRIREPIETKKQLFDVGIGGPIAGFVISIPVLIYGILHTRPNPFPVTEGTLIFHYPLLITGLQKILTGHTFSSFDVVEHPALIAGWFGLLVTAINLLPLGQLDGGHLLYAVMGRHYRKLAIPLIVVLAVLGFWFPGWWLWAALLLLLGLRHPPVLDEDTRLDRRRYMAAAAALVIFILCFMPIPLQEVGRDSTPRRAPIKGRGTLVYQLDVHGGAKLPC